MEKGEIAQNENSTFFQNVFYVICILKNPLIATFQLSSVAFLNSGWYQNEVQVLGNGLKCI